MAGKPLEPNAPLTVYNTQTMQPEKLRSGEVEQSILAGSHDVPAGQTINVVGPDGKTGGGVPSERLRDYLDQGYRLETPFEKEVNDYVEDQGDVKGAVKAGFQSFVNEAGFGVPEVIQDRVQNPLDLAKRKRLQEEHEAASIAGTLSGVGASLLYGGPVFKGAEIAGKAASKLVTKGLERSIVKAGADKVIAQAAAKSLAGKIPSAAAQYAVEGGVMSAPRALTEAAFGDIEAAAESMVLGVGVGAALGGVGSLVSPSAKAINSAYKRFVKRPTQELLETEAGAAARAAGQAGESGLDELAKGRSYLRENADQIDQDIMDLIGEPATPGMRSKSVAIQDAEGKMALRSTEQGIKVRDKHARIGQALEDDVATKFGLGAERDAQSVAREASESLNTRLREIVGPSEQAYAQLDQVLKPVQLVDDEMARVYDSAQKRILKKAEELQIDVDSPIIKDVLHRANITRTPNLDAGSVLKRSQKLGANAFEASKALGNIDRYEHSALFREAQDALVEELSGLLERRAIDLGGTAPSGAQSVMYQLREAKEQYAKFKKMREPVAELLGISNKTGREGFEAALDGIDPEKLVPKLMRATQKQLEAVRQVSPELADMILATKQASFANKAQIGTRDGLSIAKIATAYKKAISEGKRYMFSPEQQRSMERALRIQEALPPKLKNFNPSGTAAALESNTALGGMLRDIPVVGKIAGAAVDDISDNVSAKIAEQMTKSAAIPQTQKLMQETGKILKRVDEAITNALKRGERGVTPKARAKTGHVLQRILDEGDTGSGKPVSQMTPQERMQEYARRSESFASNLDASQERLDDLYGGFYHYGAPQAAGRAMSVATNAVNYLSSKMPVLSKPKSMFDEDEPSRVPVGEIAAFERRLEVADSPAVVAERLAEGTLTKEHVETLAALYPAIYGYMRQVANERMAEYGTKKMPYTERLKLSLLLGLDLHPSVTGDQIASYQTTFLPVEQGGAAPSAGGGGGQVPTIAERTQTPGQAGQMS